MSITPTNNSTEKTSFFRRLFQRSKWSVRRAVRQQPSPKTRMPHQQNGLRALVSKSIFSRKRAASAQSLAVSGHDGAAHSATLLRLMRQAPPQIMLEALRQTAIAPHLSEEKNQKIYAADFYQGFHQALGQLSDTELAQLDDHLNSAAMRDLRSGLAFAAQSGLGKKLPKEAGVLREFATTVNHLEGLSRMIAAEINLHRGGVKDIAAPPEPLKNWKEHHKTKRLLLNFSKQIAPMITSSSGNMPPDLFNELKNDLIKLSRESEVGPPDKSIHKEGGVAWLEQDNPNSEELNVSEIYIVDFARAPKTFDDGKQKRNHIEIGYNNFDRKAISDHITNFCEGRANQARRLNALLTQQTLAPIYKIQAQGRLGASAKASAGDQHGVMVGDVVCGFDIKRTQNGDVRVHIHQALNPKTYMYQDEQGVNMEPLDDRRSFIEVNLDVVVPKENGAETILENSTYTTHIVEGGDSAPQ